MFNLVSVIIGVFALCAAVMAFLPHFAAANWLIVPLAAMGVGFGILSRHDFGRKLNTFVLVIGVIRLILRSGWF